MEAFFWVFFAVRGVEKGLLLTEILVIGQLISTATYEKFSCYGRETSGTSSPLQFGCSERSDNVGASSCGSKCDCHIIVEGVVACSVYL